MPRRTFFRSASEKKISRKNQKYDQKIQAQQQQQQQLKLKKEEQLRQQQVQHGQVDRLQASSSTNGSDPPLNLQGPTRTAPKHSTIGGQRYTSHEPNNTSHDPSNNNISQIQETHGHHQQYQVQPYMQQNADPNHYINDTAQIGHAQVQQQQQQQQQNVVHQDPISHSDQLHLSHEQNLEQHIVPTVESATDQMWQCGTGDFRSGSLAIQLLRLAVVTDWEQRQQNAGSNNDQLVSFPYDPSETFLSLQGAALRFHANFDLMRADRDAYAREFEGPDSLEWELTEQTAWEVWEESLRASAALAHASVGPGWRYQLELRRQLSHEAELRSLYGPSLPYQNQVIFDDYSDAGSSLGSYSMDISNPQSSHFSQRSRPPEPALVPMPGIMERFRVVIPEVLPAAMIRFAASVIDCTPTLLRAQSKIIWKEEQTQQQMQSIILQQINEERRWIRRMKRLGDTQRDLTFALFCVGGATGGNGNAADSAEETGCEWSIPRSHVPMATMICSWLTCCTVGWPMPTVFDEVPCRFEEILQTPSDDAIETEAQLADEDAPPTEIVFPAHKGSTESETVQHENKKPVVSVEDQINRLQVKFSYWSDLVSLSKKDWWYTLRVLRDCSDLVSSGWCPPPSEIGNKICVLLVEIALDGLSLFNDSREDMELHDEGICRESCSAESLALLKNLATRDVLPLDSVDLLCISLCRLLSASEQAISSTSVGNDEQHIMRTFVASNSAELLWILLSTESTSCPTCDSLLNVIDRFLPENQDLNRDETIIDESGAISAVRALSAALWGDPPSVQGVSLLRYFWEYVIDLFGKALSTHATGCNDLSTTFALEIVLALRRLVDGEMVYGNGDLIPTEWEAFVNLLDIGICPWLSAKPTTRNEAELYDEIVALYSQIQLFLEIGHEYHPIVDEDARNKFHIHILRQCVPRMATETAAALGLAAIKSWSCSVRSYLPCRDGIWLKHAISFVSEAFAKYDGECNSSFSGGYVHSPLTRLEALQSLLSDRGSAEQQLTDSASVATSISAVTTGTGLSGSCLPTLSLFTLTRNLRDMHLELINKLLLPALLAILAPDYQIKTVPLMPVTYLSPQAGQIESCESFNCVSEYAEAEFLLLKYAVRVIGLLFKSRSGDRDQRQHFIEILKCVAMSKPHAISSWNIDEKIDLEIFRLQLEAIRQLEICLQAPFRDLPHTHSAVPTILNAICDIVTQKVNRTGHYTDSILCLAAIIPLARLSCTRNGHGLLLPRNQVICNIPDCILTVLCDDGWIECSTSMNVSKQSLPMVLEELPDKDGGSDDIAPFIFIKQGQSKAVDGVENTNRKDESSSRGLRRHNSIGNDRTIIDIELVAATVKDTLCQTNKLSSESDGAAETNLSPIIRVVCFNTISSFLSHGLTFPNPAEEEWLGIEGETVDEFVSKSMAVSLVATIIGKVLLSKKLKIDFGESFVIQIFNVLVGLVLEHTEVPMLVKNACGGLVALLTSIQKNSKKDGQNEISDEAMTDVLTPFVQHMCQLLEHQDAWPGSILIPLINVTRSCIVCSGFKITKPLCRRILLACLKISGQQYAWYLQVIIFFLGVEIIDLISAEQDVALFLTLGSSATSRIQPLLLDILRSKVLYKRLYSDQKNEPIIYNREPFKVHSELARKMIAIENYPFEADGMSAWKCGGALLTLRMGSTSSLYRGWIEIVLRSPSCTVRRLVRVDNDISSKNPENLLSFWTMLRPPIKLDDVSTDENDSIPCNKQVDSQEEKNDAFAKAKNLMEHFDNLIQNDPFTNELEQSMCNSSHSIATDSIAASFSFTHPENDIAKTPSCKLRKLKRSVSDGDIVHHLIVEPHKKGDILRENDVNSWILNAFGKYSAGDNVLQELGMLGFSHISLGLKTNVDPSNQIIYHDNLKPCMMETKFTRALNILDRATPFQTHRVSLLYGGPLSQKASHRTMPSSTDVADGDQFLLATQASTDFWAFARELGDIVPVRHLKYFSGGLDTSDSSSDGSFAIVWFSSRGEKSNKEVPAVVDSMIMFHTVTLMPNKVTNRKRHVGNDIVHIVYGLETETLDVDHERLSISGHFGFVTIYVIPFVCIDMVKISVHLKKGLDESICEALSHLVGSRVVSRKISAETVRSLCCEADLICLSMIEEKLGLVLNIEERAMKINDMNRHLKK